MAQKPILVVLAAGMGSRYGGLKQIDPVGIRGEAILDYSVYDAHAAGFETVVIIIKEAIREDFMQTVGKRLEHAPMEIRYVFQELDKLPEGYAVPAERVKPWGTGHALLCAREAIGDAPFAVINSDDYYGRESYRAIYEFLAGGCRPGQACLVSYRLDKTLTDFGAVTRGICQVGNDGILTSITEQTQIERSHGIIRFPEAEGAGYRQLPPETVVSMNLWGFAPGFLEDAATRFPAFLDKALAENPLKGEYILPQVVEQLRRAGKVAVRVLSTPDQWYGVTYAADKPLVMAALRDMTEAGKYPVGLWD